MKKGKMGIKVSVEGSFNKEKSNEWKNNKRHQKKIQEKNKNK